VDSILIDEARTPLIISGPSSESARLYYQFAGVARSLARDTDYEVDEEKRTVAPTEEGIERSRACSASTTSTTWARPTWSTN
jgi:preprotein translocase subunit SecA